MSEKKEFVHLHIHSEYSLLDGACKIRELVAKTAQQDIKTVAVTDHGCMYGIMEFYKEAKSKGVKPILGCEVYVAKRSRFDKEFKLDKEIYHLVLLCENKEGYHNLCKLVSLAYTEGFYRKPRVDKELLRKYSKGLIALSACLAGEIPRALSNNDYNEAKKKALEYEEIFGKGNFFIEIQNHGLEEQIKILPMLINLSKETNIPLVATNDCHYINPEDSKMHKVLLCIQTNHTLDDEDAFEFGSNEFYLKSPEEMYELFAGQEEALKNTVKIADRCNVDFEFGKTILPHFELANNQDHLEYIREESYRGLYNKYGEKPEQKVIDRLEYELSVINKMGYVDYFLIVHDFIKYAKEHGIAVGPGRGSGAGSIVAYLIGITSVDPIKYGLIFERFLNPERVSMPDFDVDFCYENRQKVIDYVVERYGADHVAQIVTFGTMAARGAIRDVGRVMSLSYAQVDVIAKLIPTDLKMTIDKAMQISQELQEAYKDSTIKELIDTARKIEGMPRQTSTHAAGVVITKEPVDYYVPLAKNNDAVVTQYTMTLLEQLGLLKMDFLGLRNLTVIQYTEQMLGAKAEEFSVENIDTADKGVYEMLSRGDTVGVFQFESAGMKNVLTRLKPTDIEDLIAVISLYRPGPMDSIPKYIENRHNPKNIKYIDDALAPILDVTYGCIVYQEQVMQIFRELAGYSLGRADIVRRAMSKKKHDVMKQEKEIFINGLTDEQGNIEVKGCLRNGISKANAEKIFSEMEGFASYAFNKSHAAAYALISYQTAYFKYHFPKEYMAALLSSVWDTTDKVGVYVEECKNMGIKILPPSVNDGERGFSVSPDGIRFALIAMKGLGSNIVGNLLKERNENGKFTSFLDFCDRMYNKDINKKSVESLIKGGALDGLSANRRQMIEAYPKLSALIAEEKERENSGQLDFFSGAGMKATDDFVLPDLEEFTQDELLQMEHDTLGMYVSGHPLEKYRDITEKLDYYYLSDVYLSEEDGLKITDGQKIDILCIINKVLKKNSRNNRLIALLNVEDLKASAEVIVSGMTLSENAVYIKEKNIVRMTVTVCFQENQLPRLFCDAISTDFYAGKRKASGISKKAQVSKLYIRVPSENSNEKERALLLVDIYSGGRVPVFIYCEDTKKIIKAPAQMNVFLNDTLINELKRQLGNDNVKTVIKE